MATSPTAPNAPAEPGFPMSALNAAISAARLAAPLVRGPRDRSWLIVPPGFRVDAYDDPHALPPYVRAEVRIEDRESMATYVNRFSDTRSVLFAAYGDGKEAPRVVAALDWHERSDPGAPDDSLAPQPACHRATLTLRPSEEFGRWSALQGKLIGQGEFARFLEENAADILSPEAGQMIEIARDLEATVGVQFRSTVRLDNGDRGLVYETETKARGTVAIPRSFRLLIPLWHGEAQQEVECLFRWKIAEGGLAMGFEWRRVEYVRQAQFRELAHLLAEQTGLPLVFGTI